MGDVGKWNICEKLPNGMYGPRGKRADGEMGDARKINRMVKRDNEVNGPQCEREVEGR